MYVYRYIYLSVHVPAHTIKSITVYDNLYHSNNQTTPIVRPHLQNDHIYNETVYTCYSKHFSYISPELCYELKRNKVIPFLLHAQFFLPRKMRKMKVVCVFL